MFVQGETLFERLSRKNMGSAVSVPGLDDAPTVTKGMVLPFQPLSMTFSDVHYFVPLPAVRRLQPSYYQRGTLEC